VIQNKVIIFYTWFALFNLINKIGDRLRHKESFYTMNDVRYSLVQNRLSLAKRLLEQGEKLRDFNLIQAQDDGWTHPYIQHDALINYLLLTCFDILGQSNEWLPFNSWLEASKKKCERDEAVKRIPDSAKPVEIAKVMYAEYQKIYGVKTSFYRFIDEILTEEAREQLLLSVRIEQKEEGSVFIDDAIKKKVFLYESRNLFPHHLIPTGSPARGVWPELMMFKNNQLMWGYIHVRTKNDYFYSVRRWPFELFEIISKVIGQYLEIYDFNLECRVFLNDRQTVIENIKFSDLKHLEKLSEIVANRICT
jgi:hypothetical protein